jgi:hypothetical protein
VIGRWWWPALVAMGFAAGRATGPDRHWSVQDGTEWRALSPEGQRAYADGFLTGAGFAQAAMAPGATPDSGSGGSPWNSAGRSRAGPDVGPDSAAVRQVMGALAREGRFRFPYGANVYLARVNDYYWWEDHRPLPIWYAFWEVNASLISPSSEPPR